MVPSAEVKMSSGEGTVDGKGMRRMRDGSNIVGGGLYQGCFCVASLSLERWRSFVT